MPKPKKPAPKPAPRKAPAIVQDAKESVRQVRKAISTVKRGYRKVKEHMGG